METEPYTGNSGWFGNRKVWVWFMFGLTDQTLEFDLGSDLDYC